MLKISCRLWFSVLVGIGALVGGEANVLANPIQTTIGYDTTGSVGSTGVSGTPVVGFQGVIDGSSVSGTPFSFGNFVVTLPPDGTETTYSQTPFTIQYDVKTVNGANPSPNEGSVTVDGVLEGTVQSNGQSDLTASFRFHPDSSAADLFTLAPFYTTGSIVNHLFPAIPGTTSLSPNGGGISPLNGMVEALPVPEPSAMAVLLAGSMGYLYCRRRSVTR